jgi:hypothetical protein
MDARGPVDRREHRPTEPLGARLRRETSELARATRTSVGVTGPAAQLSDCGKRTSEGLFRLIAALAALSWLALVPVCRLVALALLLQGRHRCSADPG